ncbi:MAG: hypothetical protein ACM3MK_12190, partial [Chitinophagales bacterium]
IGWIILMTPEQSLLEGLSILDPYMKQKGFDRASVLTGEGSGGNFAYSSYFKEGWILELHFRYSLGLVTYRFNETRLDHVNYMKLLGVYGQNKYPGFSTDSKSSFERLLFDLDNFCSDFLTGSGEDFKRLAQKLGQNSEMFKGLKGFEKYIKN